MRIMYKDVEVEVDIDYSDVCRFINDYADSYDLIEIKDSLNDKLRGDKELNYNPFGDSLIDSMKLDLFIKASKLMTLEELEEKLGLTYI